VSSFGLQFAVASGATVIATSSCDEKLKIATDSGAKHVINYKTTPDWDEEVKKITGGRGADHILEIGGAGTLAKSMNAVRTAGWIHIIGGLDSVCLRLRLSFGPSLIFTTQTHTIPVDIIPLSIGKAIIFRGIQIGSVAQ
jgi:NADPH:quinone reductase-like Zn-dependent oxidoreductase